MKVDKRNWTSNAIGELIKSLKTQPAVQKKNYLREGKYPIISQEKDFISGYSNSDICLNKNLGEVIIFGDHTRIVKYIDFDFCVGADGVKVLRPQEGLNGKYLYHFIKWSNVPSNGYSRHFKFLKEIRIKFPEVDIQQAIASELDAIQKMIDGYREQIEDLDALAQSIFLDTFGDPITNPKGWEIKQISELGKIITGNTPPRSNPEYYNSKDIEWIKTDNIVISLLYPTIATEYLSSLGARKGRVVKDNAILICCIAGSLQSIGRCCITNRSVAFNQQINALECDTANHPLFIYWLIRLSHQLFMDAASTGMKHILSKSEMSYLRLPVPPIGLQHQFAIQAEAIERQKELLREQLADAEMLMAERMQYYFS